MCLVIEVLQNQLHPLLPHWLQSVLLYLMLKTAIHLMVTCYNPLQLYSTLYSFSNGFSTKFHTSCWKQQCISWLHVTIPYSYILHSTSSPMASAHSSAPHAENSKASHGYMSQSLTVIFYTPLLLRWLHHIVLYLMLKTVMHFMVTCHNPLQLHSTLHFFSDGFCT